MDDNLHNPEQDQDHLDINKLLDERLRIDRLIDRRCKKNITIIFRDIVGSTKYFEIDGDVEGRTMIQKHNNLLFPIIESFNGQIIKTISDSIMAKFDSANEALEASISIQKALWSYNEEFKRKRDSIRVRIGAHSGTAVETSGDYYGDMINTAARIESKAGMDEILVSGDKVHNLSEDKKTKCVFIMSEKLSGKAVEIDIYAVNWKDLDKNAFMDSLSSILLDKKGKKSLSKKSPTNKVTDGRQGVYLLEKFKLPPRRHIKKKTQRGNPYLNRIMIMNPTDYFGRKLIIRKIFSKIDSARSQSISIIGDRKIGKSSLLNYLMQPETRRKYLSDPDSYVFVYLDFQQFRRNTMEDFFRTVFNGLIREFMGNISINVEPDFRGLLEVVEEFERNNLNLIFLFDEFEVITKNKHFTLEFFSCFRSIANCLPVSFVTASGKNQLEMCHSREICDSPFFNIFTVLHLGPFSHEETNELVDLPSANCNVPLTEYADHIREMAGCLPFNLQIACSVYFELLEHSDSVGLVNQSEVEN